MCEHIHAHILPSAKCSLQRGAHRPSTDQKRHCAAIVQAQRCSRGVKDEHGKGNSRHVHVYLHAHLYHVVGSRSLSQASPCKSTTAHPLVARRLLRLFSYGYTPADAASQVTYSQCVGPTMQTTTLREQPCRQMLPSSHTCTSWDPP
jgi:hypothetical protein